MREFTEQELIRREKLNKLIEKGIDPFGQKISLTSDSKKINKSCYPRQTFTRFN